MHEYVYSARQGDKLAVSTPTSHAPKCRPKTISDVTCAVLHGRLANYFYVTDLIFVFRKSIISVFGFSKIVYLRFPPIWEPLLYREQGTVYHMVRYLGTILSNCCETLNSPNHGQPWTRESNDKFDFVMTF